MAKAKKTKKEIKQELEQIEVKTETFEFQETGEIGEITSDELGSISIEQEKLKDCEWVFQFDEDEPQVFAWTDEEMQADEDPAVTFRITNVKNSYINFVNLKGNKKFKIFVRELSAQGLALRDKQREDFKNSQKDLENFDQKIEDYASENKEA